MPENQDDPSRTNQELRKEVDRLRLENQTLRIELANTADLRRMIRKTLGLGWREIRDRVHRMRYGVRTTSAPQQDRSFNESFRPYPVRTLRPPEVHRPRVLHVIANFWTG